MGKRGAGGFTLIELLVVVGVLSLLLSILVPSLAKVKRHTQEITNKNNLHQIAMSVNLYAMDNNDRYPITVATIGNGSETTWMSPTKLIGPEQIVGYKRSVSSYLYSYLEDSKTIFCPNAPKQFQYIQEAWEAGDDWVHPDEQVSAKSDALYGTYSLYWGYRGSLTDISRVFRGPTTSSGAAGESSILVGDCLGYNLDLGTVDLKDKYFSCERLKGGNSSLESWNATSYWWRFGDEESVIGVKVNAAYTDGHVSSYSFDDSVRMAVSKSFDGRIPRNDGPEFFLPKDGI